MHFHFDFSAVQILWTLTFAALLVLLVALLGRDRARRFPWFTAATAIMALRLAASRLLFGRIAPIVFSEILLVLAAAEAIAAMLVVVEMARRAFADAKRGPWIAATLVLLAVGGAVLAAWGPWPSAKTLFTASTLAILRLVELVAERTQLLADLLMVQLGFLITLFGRRFSAGWRSHVQQLVIGLSTVAIAEILRRAIWQAIALHTTIHSLAEYNRVIALRDRIYNANNVIVLVVLVWWIVCLWFDEPGAATAGNTERHSANSKQSTAGRG